MEEKWLISLCSSYRQESPCNRAVMTNRKSGQTAPAEKKIFRTPNTYGYFTATYTPIKPLIIPVGHVFLHRLDAGATHYGPVILTRMWR